MLAALCCGAWEDDAGELVAEGRAPVLPDMSPSTLAYLAFSASLAQADAKIFW